MLAPAQFPPQTLYLVVSGVHSPGPRLSISADPFGEIELMKHRSVDLIDTHYQPKIDWQSNVIGGWIPSLTLALAASSTVAGTPALQVSRFRVGKAA
ncbi:MAG: hypothetical protein DME26_04620 [Verrucomicrobia bacterium]|nr:MAG: hypothetical protein DME26_04620 [Verrucomicrobiota bacterium]